VVSVHMIIGSLVVIAYIVLAVVNWVQLRRNEDISWSRQLSMLAGVLLLAQIAIGFNLLAGDHSMTAAHYIVALLALVPVGVEHSMARARETQSERHRLAALATTGTAVVVLIAYAIAESRG
jgi:peptidoglycan/LPS O-acetylase OafA/YrhL